MACSTVAISVQSGALATVEPPCPYQYQSKLPKLVVSTTFSMGTNPNRNRYRPELFRQLGLFPNLPPCRNQHTVSFSTLRLAWWQPITKEQKGPHRSGKLRTVATQRAQKTPHVAGQIAGLTTHTAARRSTISGYSSTSLIKRAACGLGFAFACSQLRSVAGLVRILLANTACDI